MRGKRKQRSSSVSTAKTLHTENVFVLSKPGKKVRPVPSTSRGKETLSASKGQAWISFEEQKEDSRVAHWHSTCPQLL